MLYQFQTPTHHSLSRSSCLVHLHCHQTTPTTVECTPWSDHNVDLVLVLQWALSSMMRLRCSLCPRTINHLARIDRYRLNRRKRGFGCLVLQHLRALLLREGCYLREMFRVFSIGLKGLCICIDQLSLCSYLECLLRHRRCRLLFWRSC